MFCSNLDLYLLYATSTLTSLVTTENVSRRCHTSVGGQTAPFENHCSDTVCPSRP